MRKEEELFNPFPGNGVIDRLSTFKFVVVKYERQLATKQTPE
jgi:hypothetical protein